LISKQTNAKADDSNLKTYEKQTWRSSFCKDAVPMSYL
jgi:hypothetical protein